MRRKKVSLFVRLLTAIRSRPGGFLAVVSSPVSDYLQGGCRRQMQTECFHFSFAPESEPLPICSAWTNTCVLCMVSPTRVCMFSSEPSFFSVKPETSKFFRRMRQHEREGSLKLVARGLEAGCCLTQAEADMRSAPEALPGNKLSTTPRHTTPIRPDLCGGQTCR